MRVGRYRGGGHFRAYFNLRDDKKILARIYYPKKSRNRLVFFGGRAGERFGIKTGIDFAYRV